MTNSPSSVDIGTVMNSDKHSNHILPAVYFVAVGICLLNLSLVLFFVDFAWLQDTFVLCAIGALGVRGYCHPISQLMDF